jgi:glycerol-3-phosphate acyltransferase PlsY
MDILLVPGAYLLGSVPSSVWIGQIFFNTDVREHGSGNAGTTNAFRVLGTRAGIIVFILDLVKGFFAVSLAHFSSVLSNNPEYLVTYQLMLGIVAIIGHIFPVFAGFNGGKGVATLFGAILGISFIPTLIMAGVFLIILLTTRYVSLSSISAGLTIPVLFIVVLKYNALPLIIFSLVIPVLIILTHQKNIERLINNNEAKANLSRFGLKGRNRR